MSDILRTNDNVLRVMDLYNSKMTQSPSSEATPTALNGEGSVTNGVAEAASSSSAAIATTSSTTTGSDGQATGTAEASSSLGRDEAADTLIDLADLNFDPTPSSGAVGGGDLNSSTGLSSLMDDLSALGMGTLH